MQARDLKSLIGPFRAAAANYESSTVAAALASAFAPDARLSCCHPFGELVGPEQWQARCLTPLHEALPDLERRDLILLAGTTPEGQHWIGAMGNYLGTFRAPLLDIPPTGGLVHMRYHEFFQVADTQVVAAQIIWDLPELMMQARAWPLAPQLGAFLCTPAPMTGDGLAADGDGQATMDHVLSMLTDLLRHPANPDPAVMNLERYWHPRVNWYGPAGIGTARGSGGFRHWHQIPFLKAMPDRGLDDGVGLMSHWVAQGNYVCETGWPNMRMTLSDGGWMGIAPPGKTVSLRSLDFWRLEDGLIRENWVLVDLLDLYQQIGVDVFARLRDFNKARNLGPIAALNPLG